MVCHKLGGIVVVPVAQGEKYRPAKPVDVVIYPKVGHGFTLHTRGGWDEVVGEDSCAGKGRDILGGQSNRGFGCDEKGNYVDV